MTLTADVGTSDIRDVDSPPVADARENKVRGIRLEQDLWDELLPAAAANGHDRAGVIRQLVRWYLKRPGAKLPRRPGD